MGGQPQPTPPSPGQITSNTNKAAQANQGFNVNAQAGSQYNQGNWLGGLQYQQTGTGPGGVPIYSATTSLSPAQQGLYQNYLGTQQQAGGEAANALQMGNYGTISPSQQIGDMTSGRTGQLMNTWLGSQTPFFQTQTSQLDTQLRNQGLQPGDPAYDVAMRQLDTNQGYAVAGAASQFEPQAFNQASQLYQTPMNIGQQLAQWGAPVSPTSAFTQNTPALQPVNYAGIQNAQTTAAQNQYNAQQAQYNAQQQAMGGLFGMGGSILGSMMPNIGSGLSSAGATALGMGPFMAFSDERVKDDVKMIGALFSGLPVYSYRYKDEPEGVARVGLMAQDVEKRDPGAVHEIGGIKAVDYKRATAG